MKTNIINSIRDMLRDNVVAAVTHLCMTLDNVFSYLNNVRTDKNAAKAAKAKTEADDAVRNACDKGNIGDLLDAVSKRKSVLSVVAALSVALSGCSTVEITATERWEGRYSSASDASDALRGVTLGRGESVWMLSNRTLKRILTTEPGK